MMIHQEPIQNDPEELPITQCCHHWIIEPANGPISRGECQRCNESREFKNSVVDVERDLHYTSPTSRSDHLDRGSEKKE
jgi:hypothetical protein